MKQAAILFLNIKKPTFHIAVPPEPKDVTFSETVMVQDTSPIKELGYRYMCTKFGRHVYYLNGLKDKDFPMYLRIAEVEEVQNG